MEVYKIVIPVIALVIVILLSVIAEMLGKAQETRRVSLTDRRKTCTTDERKETQKDESITSSVSQTRIDCQQKRESPQPDVRKQTGASSEKDR